LKQTANKKLDGIGVLSCAQKHVNEIWTRFQMFCETFSMSLTAVSFHLI